MKWAVARGKRQPSAFSNANLSHAAHATLMHCLKKRAEPPLGGDRVAARRAADQVRMSRP